MAFSDIQIEVMQIISNKRELHFVVAYIWKFKLKCESYQKSF